MMFLRQSTAGQIVKLGPFVDSTDGATRETGLSIANTDIDLSKNGGAFASKNSGGGTHDSNGYYTATFDATDSDTLGRLQVEVTVSGALAVYHEFMVLDQGVYDTYFSQGSGIIYGVAQTGTLTIDDMTTDLTGYANDELIGRVVTFTSGTAEGQQEAISDYSSTNGQITFNNSLTTVPANGDQFKIT